MHDLIRLLLAAFAIGSAAVAIRRADGRSGLVWPYAEPACILLAAAVALGLTYLL
ncbi:MAG TPA: hypothetical protein VHC49_06855 [Mycobacteriales bacterium]|nr:hypothetical protein [Mycobacteriales bacterium]